MNLGHPNKDLDGTSKNMTVNRDTSVISIKKITIADCGTSRVR